MTLVQRPPVPAEWTGTDALGRRLRGAGLLLAGAIPLAAFAVFFGYPVATMMGRGFSGANGIDFSGLVGVLSRPRFARVAAFTVVQAAASAALAIGFGVPGRVPALLHPVPRAPKRRPRWSPFRSCCPPWWSGWRFAACSRRTDRSAASGSTDR